MALIYEFDLPQLDTNHPEAGDVINGGYGEVRLVFDGVDQPPRRTAVGDLVISEVSIPKGVTVGGLFTFVDNDGNDSKNPSALTSFVASDTIPAPDPVGPFAARLVREDADPV